MKTWAFCYRADGRVEVVCEHGVGHPTPESVARVGPTWAGIHGCDGCCWHGYTLNGKWPRFEEDDVLV